MIAVHFGVKYRPEKKKMSVIQLNSFRKKVQYSTSISYFRNRMRKQCHRLDRHGYRDADIKEPPCTLFEHIS